MRKILGAAVVALGLAAGGLALGAGASQGEKAQWKYVVVKLPPGTADIEFTGRIDGHKLKNTVVTPLDSLGRDGWELVAVLAGEGGGTIAFFKAPR